METSRPHARNVSSGDVEGATVYDGLGKKIGKIDHLIIAKTTGKVLSAIANVMGFFRPRSRSPRNPMGCPPL
jgi:uncharacterized protein YrrD